jgi:hypothetical protein
MPVGRATKYKTEAFDAAIISLLARLATIVAR